ncbi:MAG: aspartate/glutamate racemase family protein [Burkholderiaceae bacterium]|nr:aspartate/glutamate racemase family protein [Burkholderiaceae bacterium]
MTAPRIFLVHAVDVSMAPASSSFKQQWPEASIINVLEESLAVDMLADGKMTPRMIERFLRLGQYCVDAGADGILFTCSAFGEAINHVKTQQSIPILTSNQAMFEALLERGGSIAMLTTFGPSLQTLRDELSQIMQEKGVEVQVDSFMVEGALDALLARDQAQHDLLIAEQINRLDQYSTIVLGQFSMAAAAKHSVIRTQAQIMTTPDSAVKKLKQLLK